MSSAEPSRVRRNRIFAIAAGVITTVAITLALASGYLGQRWLWLRPAGELLLLAELVGLIVLERHQLFEPVSEKVTVVEARTDRIEAALEALTERLTVAGQATFYANPVQTLSGLTRTIRATIAREQEAPQILRYARLGSRGLYQVVDPEIGQGFLEVLEALSALRLLPSSRPDSKARSWSCRFVFNMPNVESFDSYCEHVLPVTLEPGSLNVEAKLLVRSRTEAVLTPNLVTDRDVILTLDDINAPARWGVLLQGRQYVAVFARWFDELWASIPETYLIYSRGGLNQSALDRIRKELEAAEAGGDRRTA